MGYASARCLVAGILARLTGLARSRSGTTGAGAASGANETGSFTSSAALSIAASFFRATKARLDRVLGNSHRECDLLDRFDPGFDRVIFFEKHFQRSRVVSHEL